MLQSFREYEKKNMTEIIIKFLWKITQNSHHQRMTKLNHCLQLTPTVLLVRVRWNGQLGIVHQMQRVEMTLRYQQIILNYLGRFISNNQSPRISLSVCSNPTHIDARTVREKISWFGSQSTLIYDDTPKPATNRNWNYGISRKNG